MKLPSAAASLEFFIAGSIPVRVTMRNPLLLFAGGVFRFPGVYSKRHIKMRDAVLTGVPSLRCIGFINFCPIPCFLQLHHQGSVHGKHRDEIRFKDGTEYLVRDDNTANFMFAVGNTDREVTFLFNRMIDVNEISSVILDGGLEFSVS